MKTLQDMKEPCMVCHKTNYLAPYARTTGALICSRKCWEVHLIEQVDAAYHKEMKEG